MSDDNKFKGWRRLIFVGAVLLAATVSLGFGLIESEDWKGLLSWLSGAYLGSDGIEKGAAAYVARGDQSLGYLVDSLDDPQRKER